MLPPNIDSTSKRVDSLQPEINSTQNSQSPNRSKRNDEIAGIRDQIKNGNYKVDLGKLANGIIGSGALKR